MHGLAGLGEMVHGQVMLRFWAKVERGPECWRWMGAIVREGSPYGRFRNGSQMWLAHRFVWLIAHGSPPPETLLVCHHCDNPRCVRPDHLFLGTYADNAQDCIVKGRRAKRTMRPFGRKRAPGFKPGTRAAILHRYGGNDE